MRRMAEEYRMIEPFEAEQVRRNSAGNSLVSYGTSSYGYDVRCADEFKIFTNINSAVVDPKDFADDSFVDFKGDVRLIEPDAGDGAELPVACSGRITLRPTTAAIYA